MYQKKSIWWSTGIRAKDKKRWNKCLQTKREDHRKYKNTRTEVKHLIKEVKKHIWDEFEHKMKKNYLDNEKLCSGTLKQQKQQKPLRLNNIKQKERNISNTKRNNGKMEPVF